MNLDIITPDKTVYSGEIKLIKVPGSQGSFEVLKDHAPIVSSLEKGEVKVIIDKTYTLNQIVGAHQYVEMGHKTGNVAVTVAEH